MKNIGELLCKSVGFGVLIYVAVVAPAIVCDGGEWYDFWLIKFLDGLTIIFAAVAMIFAARNFLADQRANESVVLQLKIIENGEPRTETLPYTLLRKHVTRSEIQGILGNFHVRTKDNQHYSIKYIKSNDFDENIRAVQNGKGNKIVIEINLGGGDQYNFKDPNE